MSKHKIENSLNEFYAGDLGNGPSKILDLEQIEKDDYYNSMKFFIGYNEIQARLASPSTKSSIDISNINPLCSESLS